MKIKITKLLTATNLSLRARSRSDSSCRLSQRLLRMSFQEIITKSIQRERLIRMEHRSSRLRRSKVGAVISQGHSSQTWTVSCRDSVSHHKDDMPLPFIMETPVR